MLSSLYSLPVVALLWLLHFLPLPLLATIGRALGQVLMLAGRKRRSVAVHSARVRPCTRTLLHNGTMPAPCSPSM